MAIPSNVANHRWAIQAAQGTPAAASVYAAYLAGGSMVGAMGTDADFEETSGLRMRSDRQDRDVAALEATMARLDAEEQEAKQERVVDGVPPAEAVRYLRELQPTWEAANGGPGRKMLAEALFERIDVRGFREAEIHLTDAALAHGFGAVLPESFGISVNGRGERGSASLTRLAVRPRFVLENVTLATRSWPVAYRMAG